MTIQAKTITNAKGFTFNQITTPTGPTKGDTWYNPSVPEVKIYDGSSSWKYFDEVFVA